MYALILVLCLLKVKKLLKAKNVLALLNNLNVVIILKPNLALEHLVLVVRVPCCIFGVAHHLWVVLLGDSV